MIRDSKLWHRMPDGQVQVQFSVNPSFVTGMVAGAFSAFVLVWLF